MSVMLGVGAFISPAQASVAAGGVSAEDPPEPEANGVELTVDRSEVDANQPEATFTLTTSAPIASPYWLTVYDDTGRRVYSCWYAQTCATAGSRSFEASTPNSESRTYTAYVAQDAPTTGPPVSDVRGTSSVSVANLGWTGTLTLSVDRTDVDANSPTAQMTVTPSKPVVYPYHLTVYDDTGLKVYDCVWGQACPSGATFAVTPANNATRTYTAYVSLDRPSTGPPINDLRSPAAVTVGNHGWSGFTTLVAESPSVDANGPTTVLTVVPSVPVVSPYHLTVYDDTGLRVYGCVWGQACPSGATFAVTPGNNATRTYTAYASLDYPTTGPPVNDVRGTSSVSVANLGWTGTLTLSVDRTDVDANSPTAQMTVTPSKPVVEPYHLTVFDDTGLRVYGCVWGQACPSGATFAVTPGNNAARTYTAYVSLDYPNSAPPTNDVRAPASAVVDNAGWTGGTRLTVDTPSTDANSPVAHVTVRTTKPVVSPYHLTVYDETGLKVYDCVWGQACPDGATFAVTPANNATRTYTAYVALDRPSTGPPVVDVRGSSSVSVANLGWTGTLTLSVDRTDVDANSPTAQMTVTPSKPVVSPYHLTVFDDNGLRVYGCVWGQACPEGATFAVTPGNNATRTYTARVSLDYPNTGPPTDDVRSPVSIQVRNHGWTGSVDLAEVGRTSTSRTFRVTPSKPIASPYILSVYDNEGRRVYRCYSSSTCATASSITFSASHPANSTRTYVAYVAQNAPSSGRPTNDVRAISGVYSTAGRGPTDSGETASGTNPSQDCSHRCTGDPVNTTTGEFFENTTDLAVVGRGPQLGLTRAYGTTRADLNGPLGYGWTYAYDMRLSIRVGAVGETLETASQVQVEQENGSLIVFSRLPNGTYVGPERTFAILERLEDGTYVLTRRQSQVFAFDATGRLTQLRDRNNNGVTLSYDGELLDRATNDAGDFIELTWTDGRITAVTDHTGRVATYEYSAAGNLVRVTGADGSVSAYTYDTSHRIVTMTHPDGGVTTNAYGTGAKVVQQTDPLDRVMTFAYADGQTTITESTGAVRIERYVDGQVLSVTEAAGTPLEATTSYTYTAANQVESITDPLGRVTRFAYDVRGNRTSVTDPLGRVTTTTFDQFNNPLTVTNPAGETATFTYDDRGNPLTATAPDGATTTFTVNPDGTVATSTDATGRTTAYTYDAHGFLATATGPDGASVVTSYDSLGRLISSTDPRGTVSGADPADYTSTWTYDAVGRLLTTTGPVGAVVTLAYDAAGRPETVTDALGATTTKEYDVAGQLVSIEDALGNHTTMTYDDDGRILTFTDALGATTTNAYDVLGRLATVTDALGRTSHTEYDAGNRVTATVTPSGARTAYTYDVADQLLTVTDPLGGVTTTTYDDAGRPVTVTDADGRAVTTTYDTAGRPTVVTRADASTLSWLFDAAGRVLTYTDAAGAVTMYTYDAAGRRATATDTAGRTTSYGYGPSGLLDLVTLPDLQTVAYSYDTVGRRTGVDYSDATPDVTYTYDAAGQVTTMVDGIGTTGYAYDALGRTLEVDGPDATVGYEWDAVGQLTELTYPTGEVVQRAYDDAGQLTTVTDWADREFTYDWSDDGHLTELTYPNGIVTTYDYDDAGQVLGITAASAAGIDLLDFAYGYSDAGLMTSQDVTRSAEARAPPAEAVTSAQEYTWDPLGRISTVSGDGAGSFGFDAAGSVTTLADSRVLTYDAGRQLTTMTSPGSGGGADVTTTYGYDDRGNRILATADSGPGVGTVEHTYDLADRLTSVVAADGTTAMYAYSAGLRASAITGVGEDAVTENYTWDTLASVPLLLTDGAQAYVYGIGGTPLEQVALDDGGVDYLHTDLIGSVIATTDTAGQVTSEADYDVYGVAEALTGRVPCAELTRFGYAGEYVDTTGYVYLRARSYDPATAQFLTRDPLVDSTGNPYGYTDGNPVQDTDALGLAPWDGWDWRTDLQAAATTAMMFNPIGAALGVGDWDDENGENIAVNALQSYGAGVLDGLGRMVNGIVNYSQPGVAAQSLGWSGLDLGFDDPNGCSDLYGSSRVIGQWTPDVMVLVASGGMAGAARSSAATAAPLGERLFASRFLGADSRFFGNSFARGQSGLLNQAGSPLKFGWSSSGELGGGWLLRLGLGRSPTSANQALHHFPIRSTHVPNDVANDMLAVIRQLRGLK
jgi:RHS repeat-associated protein